jgi:hypothetical protein
MEPTGQDQAGNRQLAASGRAAQCRPPYPEGMNDDDGYRTRAVVREMRDLARQ